MFTDYINSIIAKLEHFSPFAYLFAFLKKRIDLNKSSGLTLTVLLFVFGYAALSFISTSAMNDYTLNIDYAFSNLLYTFRHPLTVKVFIWITFLGDAHVVAPLALGVCVLFWILKKRKYIIPFAASLATSFFALTFLKEIWARPRPSGLLPVFFADSWSFPSGHAAMSITLYGFLIYFFWKIFKKWNHKINAAFVGLLLILAVGFSRIYLGVHYLSDVWAGYMVGVMILSVSIGWLEWKEKSAPEKPAQPIR
ncbi:MAG: phosphatase PAP2 family protein [Patescibacteria group bacterium]